MVLSCELNQDNSALELTRWGAVTVMTMIRMMGCVILLSPALFVAYVNVVYVMASDDSANICRNVKVSHDDDRRSFPLPPPWNPNFHMHDTGHK